VTKVKVVNNLIYGNLTRKIALIIDFQTKITEFKTKHHMARTYCKNFSSIWQLTKREFKFLQNDSKLEKPTRPTIGLLAEMEMLHLT